MDTEALHQKSLEIIKSLIEGHKYTYKMFRGKFIRTLENEIYGKDDELYDFWFEGDKFYNMRLYKYLVELGYKRHGTVLEMN